MSVVVQGVVIHQLVQDGFNHRLVASSDLMAINKSVEEFVADVHRTYNAKPGKGYASFDNQKGYFEQNLISLLSEENNLHNFSVLAAEKLVEEINKYDFAEQGYLFITRYQALASEFLVIALLSTKEHVSVNDQLELSQAKHLDLNRLQLVLRIDLTEYSVNREEGRYISFIKGRAGRKVADFFLDFVGCVETIDARHQSKTFVSAIEDYMDSEQFTPEEKSNSRKEMAEYCRDYVDSGREISLRSAAEQITPANSHSDFYQFSREGGYELQDSFPADKTGFKNMVKFSGQGGGVSINFDKALLGSRVFFNEESDTLTIHQLPPNLRAQLLQYLKRN